jgi:hypothetical protein
MIERRPAPGRDDRLYPRQRHPQRFASVRTKLMSRPPHCEHTSRPTQSRTGMSPHRISQPWRRRRARSDASTHSTKRSAALLQLRCCPRSQAARDTASSGHHKYRRRSEDRPILPLSPASGAKHDLSTRVRRRSACIPIRRQRARQSKSAEVESGSSTERAVTLRRLENSTLHCRPGVRRAVSAAWCYLRHTA